MGLIRRLWGSPPRDVGGYIGYFGLSDWWLSEFTEEERTYIEGRYQPLGADGTHRTTSGLAHGEVASTSETAGGLLTSLSGWFDNPRDRHLAHRILLKASETWAFNLLDRHFMYQAMIQVFYKDRDTVTGALEAAVSAYEQQIALALDAAREFARQGFVREDQGLPFHVGFKQLAITNEKEGNYFAAIQLCQQAAAQGWDGDWEKRTARCRKRAPG